ncbi:MAG: transglutaminaseTgpA domain-containing protein [Acidimicrobiales bacterium]
MTVSGGPAGTIALCVVTAVTAAGLGQLFQGRSYLVPVLVMAGATHWLSYGLRRARRFPPILLGPVFIVAAALVSTWLVFPGATVAGLPDPHTWHVIARALAKARLDFANLSAPVPVTSGFLWLACLGIGATGALADVAAFRLGAPVEGVLPAFAVFLFTAGLGASNGRSAAVALWIASVLVYLLVTEVGRRTTRPRWLTVGDLRKARWAMLPAGAALAVAAVLGAVLVGPAIPGARAASLLGSSDGGAGAATQRTTVSPLVDIRAELLQPSSATVFNVSSPVATYWRLTALDTFDGTAWSADASYQPVGQALPSTPSPGGAVTASQAFSITGLDETWLPAAFRPVALSGVQGAGYNRASSSIIAARPTYDGLRYTVTSEIPSFSAAELGTATIDPHKQGISHYLALPASVPSAVFALARRVTAGDNSAYAKAMALQRFFRDNFTYSLDVAPSDSTNALVNFLFATRKGYCQQFAGAYAVMARAVGLPSRVAVGFTPGQLEADGLYHVEALDAHAWPEVDMGAYGWVPFEPTPGRGEPGATAYTGVAPAQAHPASSAPSATTPGVITPVTTPSPPRSSPAAPPRQVPPPSQIQRNEGGGIGVLGVLACILGAAAAVLGVVVASRATRRRRRWAGATSGPAAALAAFGDVAEVLARAGKPRHPAETPVAYTRRVGPSLPAKAAIELLGLARFAEAAAYAPWPPVAKHPGTDRADVRRLRELRSAIVTTIRADMAPGRRLVTWFAPLAASRGARPPGWRSVDGEPLVRDRLSVDRDDSSRAERHLPEPPDDRLPVGRLR